MYHIQCVCIILVVVLMCLLAKKIKRKLLPLKCITVKIQYTYFYNTVHCANTDTVLSTSLIQQSISQCNYPKLPCQHCCCSVSNENGPDSGLYYWLCKWLIRAWAHLQEKGFRFHPRTLQQCPPGEGSHHNHAHYKLEKPSLPCKLSKKKKNFHILLSCHSVL